jgi:hypothetical protein
VVILVQQHKGIEREETRRTKALKEEEEEHRRD